MHAIQTHRHAALALKPCGTTLPVTPELPCYTGRIRFSTGSSDEQRERSADSPLSRNNGTHVVAVVFTCDFHALG